MSLIKIYGIKNCDTMKKALKWLDSVGISYDFHDYKKHDVDEDVLIQAIKNHGWEAVLNKRGTTWRQLSEADKSNMNDELAISTAKGNPSIIKRPLLLKNDNIYLGFKEEEYKTIFSL